ncbi:MULTISPECIES: NADH-quinone oxidoreductase subunit J [Actinopolyspora]|uniref:NADH-quinone oxidoreductase subunit J n=1 Tax=Actinopolyspora saharensis TaxID=995062 RepID=A0A1H0ZFH4_9ACTN|nr:MULTISPECIES: NADH-quinone oxidoreductase subunit J [Actinopolyspora]NHD15819.1 NADH-quinone oxidoreductase subunit J [Actinopolyspora sp. BKK2]NHE74967.1 NADH-quinone oxidoreductase subunit J [Actinopolyspora sp. BKK1]SDQ26177.1 NADH:ubiquinone oxidoreductase subunit 6 (chain J) [Actinopolyspora saharensis]
MEAVLCWVFGVAAVVFGFLVFRLDSMARVTFALLASFLFVAFEVMLLGLNYLGAVLVLMMVMEMVIMAVFMIMYMMNPAGLMPMAMYHNKAAAMSVSVGTFVVLAAGILLVDWPERAGRPAADPTAALGHELMGAQMPTMMTLGLVLFATILATVTLSTRRGRYDRFGPGLRGRPADPVPGGVGAAGTDSSSTGRGGRR